MMHELQPTDPGLIGPYRLRARLGAGGMGRVYYGLSPGGRPVAVKVIRADLAADPEFRARFRREVSVARSVSGLFTAPVIDADTEGPVPWLATEYVRGPSLADAVTQHGPLPAVSVLALARGLAEGLSAIHVAGIVHRDLKPANVLLASDGPRVIDFGISRAVEASGLTSTGLVVGSPGFMSPEQAEGRQVGPPSDIFSLGAVLAFAATGQGPFGTGSTPALVYRVVYSAPQLDSVPAEVRPLVERCLDKDPARRPSAGELLAGVACPGTGWLPEPVTRGFGLEGESPTVTARQLAGPAVPGVVAGGAAGGAARAGRRRRWRPLVVAAMVAALAGAGATAGLTMAGTSAHAAQSGRQIAGVSGVSAGSGVSGVVQPSASSAPASPPVSYSPAPPAAPASAPAYAPPSSTPPASPSAPPTSAPPSPVMPPSPVTSGTLVSSAPPTSAPGASTAAPGGY